MGNVGCQISGWRIIDIGSSLPHSFHAVNVGNMAKKTAEPLFLPCTPKGILTLLRSTGK